MRECLKVESGLNHGICVPVLFLALAADSGDESNTMALALSLVTEEMGIGILLGAAVTAVGAIYLEVLAGNGLNEHLSVSDTTTTMTVHTTVMLSVIFYGLSARMARGERRSRNE